MYPVLFEIGPFVISSFGVMMVTAFLLGNYLLKKDVVADGFEPVIAEDITFRAAIGGILGAKLYYLIETIPSGQAVENINGLSDIIGGIVSVIFGIITFSMGKIILAANKIAFGIQNFGAGLVFLGGLIGGMLAVSIYVYKKKLKWLKVADWVAPFLALGHGIGRIGCYLVGDDYGIPTNVPWACTFPNGLPPTDIPVHPTQLYEMIANLSIFYYLRYRKKHQEYTGELIFEYLFLAGFARFLVEFIRTNTKYIFDLSGAQLISIIMMGVGTWFMWRLRRKTRIFIAK